MATPLTKAKSTEIGKASYIKESVFAIQDNKKSIFMIRFMKTTQNQFTEWCNTHSDCMTTLNILRVKL